VGPTQPRAVRENGRNGALPALTYARGLAPGTLRPRRGGGAAHASLPDRRGGVGASACLETPVLLSGGRSAGRRPPTVCLRNSCSERPRWIHSTDRRGVARVFRPTHCALHRAATTSTIFCVVCARVKTRRFRRTKRYLSTSAPPATCSIVATRCKPCSRSLRSPLPRDATGKSC
jgi:hypothetical protein